MAEQTATASGKPRKKPAAKRAIIRLQLDIAAKEQLDAVTQKRGMTQIAVLSRVVKWFGVQDEVVQASILGLLSDAFLGDAARTVLGRLGNGEAVK